MDHRKLAHTLAGKSLYSTFHPEYTRSHSTQKRGYINPYYKDGKQPLRTSLKIREKHKLDGQSTRSEKGRKTKNPPD